MRPELITALGIAVLLGGCAAHQQELPIAPADPATSHITVIDNRAPSKAPGFLAGEGNIFSCHYGITAVTEKLFKPDRMTYLQNALPVALKDRTEPTTIEVVRIEIYDNHAVVLRRSANASTPVLYTGGIVGAVVAGATAQAIEEATAPGELIGCKDSGTGEYLTSEAPSTGTLVGYLDAKVNGKLVQTRSVYGSGGSGYVSGTLQSMFAQLVADFAHAVNESDRQIPE